MCKENVSIKDDWNKLQSVALVQVNLFDCLTGCIFFMQELWLLLCLRAIVLMVLSPLKYSTYINNRNS